MGWKALAMELLAKSIGRQAGHKYIRREPRAGGGWRYWYETNKGKSFYLDLHHGQGKKGDKKKAEEELKDIHALQKKGTKEKATLGRDKLASLWHVLARLSGRKRPLWSRRPGSMAEVVRISRPVLGEELVAWIYALEDTDALQALYYGLLSGKSKKSGKSGGAGGGGGGGAGDGESKEGGDKRFSRLAILALIRTRLEALGIKVPTPEEAGGRDFGPDPFKDAPLRPLRWDAREPLADLPWPEDGEFAPIGDRESNVHFRVAVFSGLVEVTKDGARLTEYGQKVLLFSLLPGEKEKILAEREARKGGKKPDDQEPEKAPEKKPEPGPEKKEPEKKPEPEKKEPEEEPEPEKKEPEVSAEKTHQGPIKDLQTLASILTFDGSAPINSGQQSGRNWARERLAEDTRRNFMEAAAEMQRVANKNRRLKPNKKDFWRGAEETARLARVAILADQGKLREAREIGSDLGPAMVAMIDKMQRLGRGHAVKAKTEFPDTSRARFDGYIQNIAKQVELAKQRAIRRSDLRGITYPHIAPNEVDLLHEHGIYDAAQLRNVVARAYGLGKVVPETEEDRRKAQVNGLRTVANQTLEASKHSTTKLNDMPRQVRLAHAMNSIADAIEKGKAGALSTVTSRADVEHLMDHVHRAIYETDGHTDRKDFRTEDIKHAKLHRGFSANTASFVLKEVRERKKTRGVARDVQKIKKWIARTNADNSGYGHMDPGEHESMRKLVARLFKDGNQFFGADSFTGDFLEDWERGNQRDLKMGISDDASLQRVLRELQPHIGR